MKYFIILFILFLFISCSEEQYPRPFGFHRIILPEQKYQKFDNQTCPFIFEYPTYGKIKNNKGDSCSIDIVFPELICHWHITLRNYKKEKSSQEHSFEDYRKLMYHHSQKATEITPIQLETPHGTGVIFNMYGEVPTPCQSFFSDGKNHALMTSIYFDTALKNDSLSPVIDRMRADMLYMVNSIRWK